MHFSCENIQSILGYKNDPFLLMWIIIWRQCVTSVFLCNPGQARDRVTQPPALMEAPATTTGMPSAAPAHLVGEETHATQVRPQDAISRGSRKLMIGGVTYSSDLGVAECQILHILCIFKIRSLWVERNRKNLNQICIIPVKVYFLLQSHLCFLPFFCCCFSQGSWYTKDQI